MLQPAAAAATNTIVAARIIRIDLNVIVQSSLDLHEPQSLCGRIGVSTMSAKPLLYLIDGSSQMYRAYHAPVRTSEGGLLHNAQGRPTNAVYIFVTMLRKLLGDHKP